MRILVVDDEKRMVESLVEFLGLEGIEATAAGDGLEARRLLEEESFDAVVTDLRMPRSGGLELLAWVKEEGPPVPVIMMSAHGDLKDAVQAMKLGAYDYLMKPFDPDELVLRLKKAVEGGRARNRMEAGTRGSAGERGLLGESVAMKEVRRLIERAAPSTATILLTGESGTGKEVAARLVHELSGREGPFVPVNVGAVPENLLESELFGHEKGAFTGADQRRMGLFEAARGGTLFLDEIGELPLHLQVKLLRVLQERKVQRLGATKGIPVDIRIVAATNRDLELEVREGRFREDLYYRINVIRIRLPPLREREGDIGLLAAYFLARFAKELGSKVRGLTPRALEALASHSFPGNVRELENAMERALILAEGEVLDAEDFGFAEARRAPGGLAAGGIRDADAEGTSRQGGAGLTLAEIERQAIAIALERNDWHRERTAGELGITRRTLLNKIKDYGIEVPSRPGMPPFREGED